MIQTGYTPPRDLKRVSTLALAIGALFFAVFGLGLLVDRAQFFHAYLVGFIFWIGLTVGSMALLMLQHLTGGAWGLIIRRVLEAASRTLPLMLIMFIPILLGLNQIYSWTDRQAMDQVPALREKTAHYLNSGFFTIRAAVYFAIWLLIMWVLNSWSLQHDRTADRRFAKRLQMMSGPGLGLLIITITFAAIDWVMSLDPAWSSTIFGLIFVASWSLSALAFGILVMSWLSQREPMNEVVRTSHFHDWGNLMMALVMLWMYFAFSQYLIIWPANLPEETTWYVARKHDGWGIIALGIVILQFMFPFLTLLSRAAKKSPHKLGMLALLILITRVVDVVWLIEPTYNREHFHFSWMDLVAPIAMGGIWIGTFAWQLQKRSLIPINDPQLEQALAAHAGH